MRFLCDKVKLQQNPNKFHQWQFSPVSSLEIAKSLDKQSDKHNIEVYDLSTGGQEGKNRTLTVKFPSDSSSSGKIAGSNSAIEIAR